jgi:choline-sulfatase
MYEESVAVPLVMAGVGIPPGLVVDTPVSLVDCYRTVLEAAGCPLPHADQRPDRNVLAEYHAAGSITGTFMVRHGRWKYIYHVGFRPELYDLEDDPGETTDLAERPDMASVLAECRGALLRICDPEVVSAEAFADQRRRIALNGGRDAVVQRGDYGYTPVPGEKPARVVK